MLVSVFDKNEDNRISIDEFEETLSKYLVKKQITVEEAAFNTNILSEKDAKEVVAMVNEDRRVKAVYEDFNFDPDSMRELEKREAEALQLIKDGKMPVEIMEGEVVIKFDQY
jgi:hypothetical protein